MCHILTLQVTITAIRLKVIFYITNYLEIGVFILNTIQYITGQFEKEMQITVYAFHV